MDNLKEVKAGDVIAVEVSGRMYARTVDRVTATQIVTKRVKFNSRHGREVGCDGWESMIAHVITPEIQIQIDRTSANLAERKDRQRCYDLFKDARIEKIRACLNILEAT